MILVTTDLHGYPLSDFKAMLDAKDFTEDDYLFILGDVIDRNGDGGVEMLEWIMEQSNVQMLLGNHEAMMLLCRFLFDEVREDNLGEISRQNLYACEHWLRNGASVTISSLKKVMKASRDRLDAIFDFVSELPLYDTVECGGKDFLLVHGGLGGFRKDRPLDDYQPDEIVWHRPAGNERYFDDVYTLFGHTPVQYLGNHDGRPFRTETWMDIDAGCAGGDVKPYILDLEEFARTGRI